MWQPGYAAIHALDIPVGGGNRWLTVVSKDEQDGPEVLLEPAPLNFEPAKVFQKALFDAGIPWTQFNVDNVQEEYDRLLESGGRILRKLTTGTTMGKNLHALACLWSFCAFTVS